MRSCADTIELLIFCSLPACPFVYWRLHHILLVVELKTFALLDRFCTDKDISDSAKSIIPEEHSNFTNTGQWDSSIELYIANIVRSERPNFHWRKKSNNHDRILIGVRFKSALIFWQANDNRGLQGPESSGGPDPRLVIPWHLLPGRLFCPHLSPSFDRFVSPSLMLQSRPKSSVSECTELSFRYWCDDLVYGLEVKHQSINPIFVSLKPKGESRDRKSTSIQGKINQRAILSAEFWLACFKSAVCRAAPSRVSFVKISNQLAGTS